MKDATTARWTRLLLGACLLVPAWLATALLPAHATPFDTQGPFVQYSLDAANSSAFVNVHDGQWVTASGPTVLNGQVGTTTITALGDVGVGKFSVLASGAGYNAGGWSGWHDRITITPTDSALLGQTAVVSFSMGVDWSAVIQGNPVAGPDNPTVGQAYVDVNFTRTGTPGQYANVYEDIDHSCSRPGECGSLSVFGQRTPQLPTYANGVATFYFNAILGGTYEVIFGMNAVVSGYGGSAFVDATHSMSWGGIQSITLAAQPLAATVTSGSGLNLLSPVPEAPTTALWALGAWVLFLSGRRRSPSNR